MLRAHYGRIVNLSSVVGSMGNAGQAAYAAAKAGIVGFTKSMARELASRQVTVNAVAPGLIETEMTAGTLADRKTRAFIESTIAMGRVGRADEIAEAILWLLSDDASFISGATIDASGGGFVFGKR